MGCLIEVKIMFKVSAPLWQLKKCLA